MIRKLRLVDEGISVLQLLMDETLCTGTIKVEKELLCEVGGINDALKAGRKYELLLRIASLTPISLEVQGADLTDKEEREVLLEDDTPQCRDEYGWKTDCYVAAKYSRQLQEKGYFDSVIEALLTEAAEAGRYEEEVAYLEQMLGHTQEYYQIDDMTRPILIYKGDAICHNVLTVFAEQFGAALSRRGKHVIYFDMGKEEIGNATRYMYQRFFAIIGVQSYMFTVKMSDEIHYLHEYVYGPKYNFIFDHPIWLRNHLTHHLKDFTVLTLDSNYAAFVKKHYEYEALLFPPAGIVTEEERELERIYDLTFIATYNDYWSQTAMIHQMEREKRFFANHLLRVMRQDVSLTTEEAFDRVVAERRMELTEEEYLKLFYDMRRVYYCVTHYYRDRVLRTILEAGIQVDVFGDSWNDCYLRKYPNLICHGDVTVAESMTIWRQSKLSLNIMSWHKAGFTERMANIMLAGAVLVTDDTAYLRGEYNGDDMLIFQLAERFRLPEQIKELLGDDAEQKRTALNGKTKTLAKHTWDKRAEEFLNFSRVR